MFSCNWSALHYCAFRTGPSPINKHKYKKTCSALLTIRTTALSSIKWPSFQATWNFKEKPSYVFGKKRSNAWVSQLNRQPTAWCMHRVQQQKMHRRRSFVLLFVRLSRSCLTIADKRWPRRNVRLRGPDVVVVDLLAVSSRFRFKNEMAVVVVFLVRTKRFCFYFCWSLWIDSVRNWSISL